MRKILLETMKLEIKEKLGHYLREEGIELYIAANDNAPLAEPFVEIEAINDVPLAGSKLLTEISIILGILGKPWQCDNLVKGIYQALQPHYITRSELAVLLMSIHIEAAHCVRPHCIRKRAVMRYIVEELEM